MPYVANITEVKTHLGKHVGESQECVSAVKKLAHAPQTNLWKRGEWVKGKVTLDPGTAIATFDAAGTYKGHGAIYIRQDITGIYVYDQWNGQPLHERRIRFRGQGKISNDGDQFYVVD